MRYLVRGLLLALGPPLGLAQFPPTPSGLTVVHSKVDEAVTISFKEARICKQAPGVKSYSGYVHLPGSVLADVGGYDINSYFMYFEARHNPSTAPLVLYFAGGPGESSTFSMLSSESGPCYVNFEGTDTINNPWSFNEHVNMLYIDQPVQTGFSYQSLVNATLDNFSDELITPLDSNQSSVAAANASVLYGTFPSPEFKHTANNSVQAAKALWHFAEHWLSSFPGYNTQSTKVGIWGNSYAGYYVPETATVFSKNFKALSPDHPLKPMCLTIDTVGITNGCVDSQTGTEGYLQFAYNNTYGVRFASEAQYEAVLHNLTKPGGCQDLIRECRALGEVGDPDFSGSNATVNKACMEAEFCQINIVEAFPKLNKRYGFDTASFNPYSCSYYLPVYTYLNTASIQEALGVPLNWTYESNVAAATFGLPSRHVKRPLTESTGDAVRQNGLAKIEYLLANNVKVAFIFGDRDYRCPWTGGEATALAAKWTHQAGFAAAGYEELQGITKNDDGALVKQYGQFSYSRVLNAGHAVSAYAPETVYRIFERTILGLDVVTGKEKVGAEYHTTGPKTSWGWRNHYPEPPPTTCMVEGRFQKRNPWKGVLGGSS